MGKSFDLPKIEALAASGAYGGNFALTDESAVLLLCAAAYLENLNLWQGAGYTLTETENDTISAMVSQATDDILEEVTATVGDYVKLKSVSHVTDTVSVIVDDIDPTGYRAIDVVISGLYSNYVGNQADDVLMEINDITTASFYVSYGELSYIQTNHKQENLGDIAGAILLRAAGAAGNANSFAGNCNIRIFNPTAHEQKFLGYNLYQPGNATSMPLTAQGTSWINNTDDFTKFILTPVLGTSFLIDPEHGVEPDELLVTVYGLV